MLPMAPGISHLRGHCAGFASRLIAFILDVVVFSLTLSAVIWSISQLGLLLQFLIFFDPIELTINRINQSVDLSSLADLEIVNVLTFVGPGLLLITYYAIFWSTTERTPGKAFMGLRVVTTEGKRLRWWRAVLRCIGYFLSGVPFGLGFVWVMFDDKRQGWHDKLSRTYVVYDWEARPDERFLVERIKAIRARHRKREDQRSRRI